MELLFLFINSFCFIVNLVPKFFHCLKFYLLPAYVRNQYDTYVFECSKNFIKLTLQRVRIHKFRISLHGIEVDALVQQNEASLLFVHAAVPSYVDVQQHILVALVTLEQDTFS